MSVIFIAPTVIYRAKFRSNSGKKEKYIDITNALELPEPHLIAAIEEPYCDLNVIVPNEYSDSVINEIMNRRGEQKKIIDMLGELFLI